MTARTVHVIGAGLAGLSAAVRLADRGERVVLHDAAKQAGGRCRSYVDPTLGLSIDNGNHLLLSGNRASLDYVTLVGGERALTVAADARFDFADLASGERWQVRPNAGRIPWWIASPSRRVPGTHLREYLAPLGLLRAKSGTRIDAAMRCSGPLWERLWRPVLLAALNTEPAESDAGLAAPVLRETLAAGSEACRPIVATGGLSAAFIAPALAFLSKRGAEIRLGGRLRALEPAGSNVARLLFTDGTVEMASGDAVVLSVPPWIATELLPGLSVPDEHRAIVNAHFKIAPASRQPLVLGTLNSVTEWIFAYEDRVSVTISAGDRLFDTPREILAASLWDEVSRATGLPADLPRWQVVKEKRATFAATPEQNSRRPDASTSLGNVVLAGDWTATGLPATIEGAIRSGQKAATLLQRGDTGDLRSVPKA